MSKTGGLMKVLSPGRILVGLGLAGLGLGAAVFAVKGVRSEVAAGVYLRKLEQVSADYEALRSRYNEAVRRTAVTELVVEDGELMLRVRNAEGVIEEIETPFDPTREIFVDYAVLDGRLWIRRVYDDATPPREAVVVNPALAEIDWDADAARHGKVVYRSLGEGRWVISVSGDGSLGLGPAPEAVELASPPEVREYEELDEEVRDALEGIGLDDIWEWLRSPR